MSFGSGLLFIASAGVALPPGLGQAGMTAVMWLFMTT
jgi:hypothetical protein